MGRDIVREALTSVTRWGLEHRVRQLLSLAGRARGRQPVGERS
jgi:dolichol-phosphate mannosyltransferase